MHLQSQPCIQRCATPIEQLFLLQRTIEFIYVCNVYISAERREIPSANEPSRIIQHAKAAVTKEADPLLMAVVKQLHACQFRPCKIPENKPFGIPAHFLAPFKLNTKMNRSHHHKSYIAQRATASTKSDSSLSSSVTLLK